MTERIGVYRVERPIGQGGMGEVVLAWDDRLERRVAIKRVRQGAGLTPEQRERFRREARLAARLSHSAVVQVYDLVTDGPDDAIVMEYVEGQTLAERVKAGPLPMGEVLRLAQEIAEGLAAAHEAGLIHRDLKSANVIVTRAGRAKILDFGLARPASRRSDELPLTQQGFVIGTLHAMSPEQARGEELDQRSDLFSLGVLLYEMLTGETPFRATEPAATLRRIVLEPPPDVRPLRPDLSAGLEALLGRLLAKNREDRPDSAAEVATILERLRSGSRPLPLAEEGSVSDQPTSPMLQGASPVSSHREPLPSSLVGPARRSGRRLWIAAAAAVLIAAVAMAVFLARPRPPLRIVVAPADVEPAGDERLVLAGSGVVNAAIAGLTSLQNLTAIDPREASRGGRSPVAMARATAAAEILISEVRPEGRLARVTLRRLRGRDGSVLGTEIFSVPIDTGDLRVLAGAVANRIRKSYPAYRLRPGVPDLDARDEDYVAFLKIKQRIDAGETPLEPELERLEAILRGSPRFLDAQLLTGQVAHALFLSTRRQADLDRAKELIRQARDLAAEDPRPLRQELQILLTADRTEEAAALLPQLENLLAGDPDLLVLRAQLAERQGDRDKALSLLGKAVRQAPSWQNLNRLASMEARNGQVAVARRRLESILRQAPHNLWALEALGYLELVYGDLARAEEIYLKFVDVAPGRVLNNLGFVRALQGNYSAAVTTYRAALARRPDHPYTMVSLADAQMEIGQTQEAEALYRRALTFLTESGAEAGPAAIMLKAQCLVRLRRPREAVDAAQAALRRNPDDSDLLYQNALVLSLAGDRSSALSNALAALDKGVQPRWFSGSAFKWLRASPEFRPYLESVTSTREAQVEVHPTPQPKPGSSSSPR